MKPKCVNCGQSATEHIGAPGLWCNRSGSGPTTQFKSALAEGSNTPAWVRMLNREQLEEYAVKASIRIRELENDIL